MTEQTFIRENVSTAFDRRLKEHLAIGFRIVPGTYKMTVTALDYRDVRLPAGSTTHRVDDYFIALEREVGK